MKFGIILVGPALKIVERAWKIVGTIFQDSGPAWKIVRRAWKIVGRAYKIVERAWKILGTILQDSGTCLEDIGYYLTR